MQAPCGAGRRGQADCGSSKPRGGQWPSPSGEPASRERTDLTSFSLLPTGQLPPAPGHPGAPFLCGFSQGDTCQASPGSCLLLGSPGPGHCSWVVRGPAGGAGGRQGSQGTFPREKGSQPMTQGVAAGSPPRLPTPVHVCTSTYMYLSMSNVCLVEPRRQLGPAGPCRARQDRLLSPLRCVEVLAMDFCKTFQGLASAA